MVAFGGPAQHLMSNLIRDFGDIEENYMYSKIILNCVMSMTNKSKEINFQHNRN